VHFDPICKGLAMQDNEEMTDLTLLMDLI